MDEIRKKLENITKAWDYYFWQYKFCNSKINFGVEARINYYADIFNYFKDTLPIINNVEYSKDFHKSILQSTGIMQTIYAHQDLIDEILYIFKLQGSLFVDKNPNRTIRNELIGHPIRRNGKSELISSIFLSNDFGDGQLSYVLYSKEHNYAPQRVFHRLDRIIESHESFLNKYLDIIWSKITKVLRQFKNTLIDLQSLIKMNKLSFFDLLNLVEARFESIFKSDRLFDKNALLYYLQSESIHERYRYVIQLFIDTLKEHLSGTINHIDELLTTPKPPITVASNNLNPISFKINIVESGISDILTKPQDHLGYEFSKLYNKHPIFDIAHFKSLFDDESLIEELNNMEVHFYNNDLEYYCSYGYLGHLLKLKNIL